MKNEQRGMTKMREVFIGELIRERRKELHLTQAELSDGICEVSTLSRIENKRQTPKNICNRCQLSDPNELHEHEMCKYLKSIYHMDGREAFELEKPFILYESHEKYYLISPKGNVKEEYTYEGWKILQCIAEKPMCANDIKKYVDFDVDTIYRFLIQCYSKSLVKRFGENTSAC